MIMSSEDFVNALHMGKNLDAEIDEMQREINKEAGLDPQDGGVDVPQDTDGITRYPSLDGSPIPADDLAKYQGEEPPEKGDKQ